jgi:branched-chain amino acid transport system permease protein
MVSLWVGLLVLPFTGPWKAALMGGSVLAAGLVWRWVYVLFQQVTVGGSLKGIYTPVGWIQDFSRNPLAKYLALAAVLFIPLFLNNYAIDVLTLTGIYVVLALGLNIVVGLAGLLDLGYIAFYAIGAYTYALLSAHYGVSFWIGMPLGGIAAAVFGMMLGLVTLRLRGDYLAIVTLGFIQIVHLVLNNWDSVTNGPNGILNIGRPSLLNFELQHPIHFYYLILAIALAALWVVSRLNRSRIGRAWIAIREDEVAAAAMGIPTTRFKVLAFTLGATWAGIAGSFFAAKFAFISPESFTFFESVFVLSMVVLGGMGSMTGAILGASLLVILPEFLRGLADYRMLFFGMLLVLMMIFRPQGLLPSPRRKIQLETK